MNNEEPGWPRRGWEIRLRDLAGGNCSRYRGSEGGGRMAEVMWSLLIQGQQNGSLEEIKWCAESHKKPLRQSQA